MTFVLSLHVFVPHLYLIWCLGKMCFRIVALSGYL